MNFQDLQEQLRLELLRRIDAGMLTGTSLARESGFQQAHISNFLNRKRALSLDGLDRVMAAQGITVDQITTQSGSLLDLSASSSAPAPESEDPIDTLPVVSPSTAMDEAIVRAAAVMETIQVSGIRLHDNRSRPAPRRAHWQRFLAIRADSEQAAAMDPVLTPGAIVVLDRHYNSIAPYRAHPRTIFAVRTGAGLALRYVDFDAGTLILRPISVNFPVQLLTLAPHETPADYIIGRICLMLSEL